MPCRLRHADAGGAAAGIVGRDREENMTMHSRRASNVQADDRQAGGCHKTVLFPSFQGRYPIGAVRAGPCPRASYWITSSAPASRFGGTSRPSVSAVLRLMISSSLDDGKTGRSPGRAP